MVILSKLIMCAGAQMGISFIGNLYVIFDAQDHLLVCGFLDLVLSFGLS